MPAVAVLMVTLCRAEILRLRSEIVQRKHKICSNWHSTGVTSLSNLPPNNV